MEMLILALAFLAMAGLIWWAGLWSGFICTINLLLAALFATAFFEPVADQIEYGAGKASMEYAYVCDFVAVWLVFFLAGLLIRVLTDSFSAVKLKFDDVTELVGRSLVALLAGGIFLCFTHFTLIMAPLPVHAGITSTAITSPHQIWMSLARGLSAGSLQESRDSSMAQPYRPEHSRIQGNEPIRVFDPLQNFQTKYMARRQRFAGEKVTRVSR